MPRPIDRSGAGTGLTRRRLIRALPALAVGGAGAALLPAVSGLGRSDAAVSAFPRPVVDLPLGVEALAAYRPQASCDPVAKPGVIAFRNVVLSTYGAGSDAGIVRGCGTGGRFEHKEGRAWDWFVALDKADEHLAVVRVIRWLLSNDAEMARRTGVMYLICQRNIWSSSRHREGLRRYGGPNPHTDHVHFSFSWAGAMKRTSWWTGRVAPPV